MTQLTDNGIFAVKVPEGAFEIVIENTKLRYFFLTYEPVIDLPPGSYEFLFCTESATEEDARKVVRELPVGARFENYNGDYPVWYHTAKESLRSLLRSKGCEGNHAIIKKLTHDPIQPQATVIPNFSREGR
jgi:hypothetical protein